MKLKVKFIMTKGEGEFPDFSLLPKSKQNTKYIKSCMTFVPVFEDVEDIIKNWKIVDDGLKTLKYKNGIFDGSPAPVVEFTFKDKNVDRDELLRGVWTSFYKLSIPEVNDIDPYFYEDHNGYTHIL
jgi:hypothetical protein